ncbi:MAG TPA: DUF2235 domain-containing protein [Gaiellaceae bacterium]|nr:DUF2235 domain-containing protein [Gaiellaceae bacterium]
MKRLIVCCDGTWNRPQEVSDGVPAPTNVAKLALALADEDHEGNEQRLHYQAGVGTRRFERFAGGAFGFGLSRNILACYRFLVDNYAPGDKLYFFGFSRGAYTARSLAGLVRNSGILRPEERDRIRDAYALYRRPDKELAPNSIAAALFRRSHSYAETYIDFVGVWDTVGALGIPIDGFRLPLLSKLWRFHDTDLSRYVLNAYHALAIDERRRPFRPTVWHQQPGAQGQTLEQVWFAGVHSDVGGGYSDTDLSEIPLLWMAEKANGCGLAFDPDRLVVTAPPIEPRELRDEGIEVAPNFAGRLHRSRKGIYRLERAYDRRLADEKGNPVDGGALASTAEERYERDRTYRPPGLDERPAKGMPVTPVLPPARR